MPLPASGQISFDDFNTELGRTPYTQIDMKTVADTLGISYNTLGTNDLQINEFYGKSILGNFTYTTAGVSGFLVAQNGTVTTPSLSKGSIASLTYSSGYSGGSFPLVTSNTVRSVTVTVNIPGGYNNSGTVSGVEAYTQQSSPIFAFSDWSGYVLVSQGGSVSYVTGNAAGVYVSPSSYSIVNVNTDRTINVTVTVPSGYYNSGQTVSGTKTVTQASTPSFAFSDWNGSVSVAQNGNVSYTLGNVDTVSVSPTSFPRVSVNTDRDITVTVTVPSGYYNSGGTVSGTKTATQPLTLSTFTFSMANVSGFAVATDGAVTAPTTQYGGIVSRTYSSGYSDGYYSVVGTDTTRSVTVVVSVPSGYSNSGGQVSGVVEAVQLAQPTFVFGNWNGSVSVGEDGIVNYTLGNAAGVSISPTYYSIVSTNTSRTINVSITVPSGYYNSGGTVSGTYTTTQPAPTAYYYNVEKYDCANCSYQYDTVVKSNTTLSTNRYYSTDGNYTYKIMSGASPQSFEANINDGVYDYTYTLGTNCAEACANY